MYFPSPRSSPEGPTESPEYMDIEGFEGFFHETTERRTVEFEDFILDSDNVDTLDGKLDIGEDDIDAELQEDSEDEELTLLKEILNFKEEDEVGSKSCSVFERTKCNRSYKLFCSEGAVFCQFCQFCRCSFSEHLNEHFFFQKSEQKRTKSFDSVSVNCVAYKSRRLLLSTVRL